MDIEGRKVVKQKFQWKNIVDVLHSTIP